jgi:uncharacterized cupin superfamily protein
MGGKVDINTAPEKKGSGYPQPFQAHNNAKYRRKLGDAGGLTQFGVNHLRLPPGQWSAERHWHGDEDEFVWILEGEVVLVTDGKEEVLRASDCACFPAGEPNGHHLQNRSDADALILEVGSRRPGPNYTCVYSDIDLAIPDGGGPYHHKDGTPW